MPADSIEQPNDWSASFGDLGPQARDWMCDCVRELAFIAGQFVHSATPADSLVGPLPDPDEREAMLEALPEKKRWDPVPGSEGSQAPVSPSEEEDEEGNSVTDQLVLTGVEEAAREQAREADIAAEPPDEASEDQRKSEKP